MINEILIPPTPFYDLDTNFYSSGYLFEQSEQCKKCLLKKEDVQCLTQKLNNTISMCSYGYSFYRVDQHVFYSFIVKNMSSPSQVYNKRKKLEPNLIIDNRHFNSYIKSFNEKRIQLESITTEDLFDTEKMQNKITKKIKEGFSNFHDYKSIISQILVNLQKSILQRYPKDAIKYHDDYEEMIRDKVVSQAEITIYHLAEQAKQKLNGIKILGDLTVLNLDWGHSYVHKAVTKCAYLNNPSGNIRRIQIKGQSTNKIEGNYTALMIILDTLIENAIKYSHKDKNVMIYIEDTANNTVSICVESFGPKITKEENIFDIFYRGKSVRDKKISGTGFGLYAAQQVSKLHYGTGITYTQNHSLSHQDTFETRFSIVFPSRALMIANCV